MKKTMKITPDNIRKFLDLLREEGFKLYIVEKVFRLLLQKKGTVRTADVIEEAWKMQRAEDRQLVADTKVGLRKPEEVI